MSKHLNDKQKKKIIADYATMGTYASVARKHKVSEQTVRRVVLRDPETAEKVAQKKNKTQQISWNIWRIRNRMYAKLLGYISDI